MTEIERLEEISRKLKNQMIEANNNAFESSAKLVEIFGDMHKGEAMEAKKFTDTIAKKLRSMKADLLP
jgi:hypothetical protein